MIGPPQPRRRVNTPTSFQLFDPRFVNPWTLARVESSDIDTARMAFGQGLISRLSRACQFQKSQTKNALRRCRNKSEPLSGPAAATTWQVGDDFESLPYVPRLDRTSERRHTLGTTASPWDRQRWNLTGTEG
jgi:hypothetical protein